MTSNVTASTASTEQLTLLPPPTVPVRFRLDEATRRRGLRHVAEIRARLERPELDERQIAVRRPAA